jgi:hypothetical protein
MPAGINRPAVYPHGNAVQIAYKRWLSAVYKQSGIVTVRFSNGRQTPPFESVSFWEQLSQKLTPEQSHMALFFTHYNMLILLK